MLGVAAALSLAPAGPAQADARIRILCPTWSGFAPVFVAADRGYFKAAGIDVSIRFEDERPNVMAAMAEHEIEMDMRTIGEYQGRPRSEETEGVIIGTIDESRGADGVIVDGSITSAADLVGKIVAAEPNIPGRLLLQIALKKSGHSLAELDLKDIVTADTVAIFADRSVAAVATFEPFLSQAMEIDAARHPKILVSSRDLPGIVMDTMIVRRDDLKAEPEKYRKFLIAVYRATALYERDPDQFIRLAAPHYNLSPADFKASIEGALTYLDYGRSAALFGTASAPGPIYGLFDEVMALNLDNGAADHRLSAAHALDASVIRSISAADLAEAAP